MSEKTVNNQFNVAGDFKGVVGDHSTVNNTSPASVEELMNALSILKVEFNADTDQTQTLRQAVAEIESDVNAGGKPAVNKLEQAVKAATVAEKTTKAVHTAIGTVVDYLVRNGGSSAT